MFFYLFCYLYLYLLHVFRPYWERIRYPQGFSLCEIERLCVKSFVCFWLLILVSPIWGKYVSVIILVALIWNSSYSFVSWLLYLDQICLNYPQDFSKYFFSFNLYEIFFIFTTFKTYWSILSNKIWLIEFKNKVSQSFVFSLYNRPNNLNRGLLANRLLAKLTKYLLFFDPYKKSEFLKRVIPKNVLNSFSLRFSKKQYA